MIRFWKKRAARPPKLTVNRTASRLDTLAVVIRTDIGNIRQNNEDDAAFIYPAESATCEKKGAMLILADGMGGYNSGEVASNMAIDRVSNLYYASRGTSGETLRAAMNGANEAIRQAGAANVRHEGMGTTCTLVLVRGDAIDVAHVGDSRAYHMRAGTLDRLTKDHTYVQYLLARGMISDEEASTHPKRNLLMQALGSNGGIEPDIRWCAMPLLPDDLILLCSDGLYEYLADAEIEAYLAGQENLEKAAETLIGEAKRRGGHDNITVALLKKEGSNPQKTVPVTQETVRHSG